MAVDDPAQGQRQVLDCWGENHSSRICRNVSKWMVEQNTGICRNVELNGRTKHKVLSTYRWLQGWLGRAGLCRCRWWPRRRTCLKIILLHESIIIIMNMCLNYHITYELIIIIMNTCLRPRTWSGRWWGLPLAGWSPGPEKENEDQNDQIVSTNYQLSELQILWWWSWSWLSSLAASGALLSLCMTSIWKQNTAWKWKQTEDQDQNIVTAI